MVCFYRFPEINSRTKYGRLTVLLLFQFSQSKQFIDGIPVPCGCNNF